MRAPSSSFRRAFFPLALLAFSACGDDSDSGAAGGAGGIGGAAGSGGTAGAGGNAGTAGTAGASDKCKHVEQTTNKVYVCFVMHNEEDDPGGVPGSNPDIPDYNGDEAVFRHFCAAMFRYANMLSGFGAKLSFQPDWTFTEGVDLYERHYFRDLIDLGNVEILPHAHETVVSYDELFARLESLQAEPEMILGGMTFDAYRQKQSWFDEHEGWSFWGAPTATTGHVDDFPAPPFAYRIAPPASVSAVEGLLVHRADSAIVATPGLPLNPATMLEAKPADRLLTPAYGFHVTREFLADPGDTAVPAKWRKRTDGTSPPYGDNLTAHELIEQERQWIESEIMPLVNEGKMEFATVREIVELFTKNEPCLDLEDQQDLTPYLP